MAEKIKVGNVYLELPKDTLAVIKPTIAEKSDVPDALDVPVFLTPRNDAVQEYIARSSAPAIIEKTNLIPEKPVDQMSEWVAFCGPKSSIPRHWLAYQENKSQHCGFNVFAFLFGVQWFVANQMYINGVLSICVEVGPAILFAAALSPFRTPGHSMDGLVMAIIAMILLASRIAIGYWANVALYKRATKEIEKVHALNLKPDMRLIVIRSAGEIRRTPLIVLYVVLATIRLLLAVQ
jgi:hypothetical protein